LSLQPHSDSSICLLLLPRPPSPCRRTRPRPALSVLFLVGLSTRSQIKPAMLILSISFQDLLSQTPFRTVLRPWSQGALRMQGDGGRRVIEDKGRILRVRASRSKSKISGRLTAYLFICSGIIREGDTLQKIDNTFVDHLDVSGVRGLLLGASGAGAAQLRALMCTITCTRTRRTECIRSA
jgi:hypothetical protein